MNSAIIITREKQYKQPYQNWTVAWKWLYRCDGVCIGYSLLTAEKWARRRGSVPVRSWEETVGAA